MTIFIYLIVEYIEKRWTETSHFTASLNSPYFLRAIVDIEIIPEHLPLKHEYTQSIDTVQNYCGKVVTTRCLELLNR